MKNERLLSIYMRLENPQARIMPAEELLLLRDFDKRLEELEAGNVKEKSKDRRGTTRVSKAKVSSD